MDEQIDNLFKEYVKALDKKLDNTMWVVLDMGHKVMMLEKSKHYALVRKLLKSGDNQQIDVAIEVMNRSIWGHN